MSGPFGSSSFNHLISSGFYNGVVSTSARFDGSSQITLDNAGSATSTKVCTLATWFKISREPDATAVQYMFHSKNDSGAASFSITLDADDSISVTQYDGTSPFSASNYDFGVTVHSINNSYGDTDTRGGPRKFRDTSGWYHLCVTINTDESAEADRIKVFINGERLRVVATDDGSGSQDFADSGQTLAVFQDGEQRWGASVDDSNYFTGYLADSFGVDGLALEPTAFGELKNGVWIPKAPSVSDFGNHGFRLQYKNTSVGSGSSSVIGADTSGKDNHFTSSGFAAHDCAMPDCPENNWCSLLGEAKQSSSAISEGALRAVLTGGGNSARTSANFAVTSGKWYWEVRQSSSNRFGMGVFDADRYHMGNEDLGSDAYEWGFITSDNSGSGARRNSGTLTTGYGGDTADGHVVMVALDVDNGAIYFGKQGSWFNNGTSDNSATVLGQIEAGTTTNAAYTSVTGRLTPVFVRQTSNNTLICNFGQDDTFSGNETAAGNADGNGFGAFQYAPPSGFLSLCTSNLPDPTIGPAEDAGSHSDDQFNTVLYTGNGSTQSITGVGFQPDLLWIKARTSTDYHGLFDSSRGSTKRLFVNETDAESTQSAGVTSFDSDGFSLGSNLGQNRNTTTFVGWNWKGNGGTTSSDGNGDITSTVQVNSLAKSSIVLYTGFGESVKTVGHGIGAVPETIWFFPRSSSGNRHVYHHKIGNGKALYFNENNTEQTDGNFLNNTTPTSSLITLGTSSAANPESVTMVAYCYTGVEGFSQFGSYVGNGANNGPYVYTGFKPAWLMIKCSSGHAESWHIWDNKRMVPDGGFTGDTGTRGGGGNPNQAALSPNTDGQDTSASTPYNIDFLSQGFKIREDHDLLNGSGDTYVYWAFAELPFKFSNAE